MVYDHLFIWLVVLNEATSRKELQNLCPIHDFKIGKNAIYWIFNLKYLEISRDGEILKPD